MSKRFLALLLSIVMMLSMGIVSTVSAEEIPEITFCLIQMDPYPTDEGIEAVEAALNAITEEKIGVHVNIECFNVAEYQTNVVLRHTSQEPIDLFVESVPDSVAAGRAADVTDILMENAPEMVAALGDNLVSTGVINGRNYGFPYGKAGQVGGLWLYRKDLVEQAGIEIGEVSTYADLTDALTKLHEAYPEMYPAYVMGSNKYPFILSLKNFGNDTLSEALIGNVSGASLMGEESQRDLKVVNMYESPEFVNLIQTTRDWYLKGFISPDSIAASESNETAIRSGKYASCFANGTNYIDPSRFSESCGYEMGVVEIGNFTQDTINYNGVCWIVSSQCKNPDAALRFLNLTYTDPTITNLLVWGIEGTDYVTVSENRVQYPEGMDASSVPYTCAAAGGYIGMQFLAADFVGVPDIVELLKQYTSDDIVSNAMGFNCDLSEVSNEVSAVVAVVDQYMPGFITGTLDLDENYDKFVSSLYDAGLQKIIDEKQTQLDAWAELNGK